MTNAHIIKYVIGESLVGKNQVDADICLGYYKPSDDLSLNLKNTTISEAFRRYREYCPVEQKQKNDIGISNFS